MNFITLLGVRAALAGGRLLLSGVRHLKSRQTNLRFKQHLASGQGIFEPVSSVEEPRLMYDTISALEMPILSISS